MSSHAEARIQAPDVGARPFEMTFRVTLEAIVTPEADGRYSAEIPALPGCYTEADDLDGLRANLVEAAECHLAALRMVEARYEDL
jgi:predicted RNase H-like HicB family nuclease